MIWSDNDLFFINGKISYSDKDAFLKKMSKPKLGFNLLMHVSDFKDEMQQK